MFFVGPEGKELATRRTIAMIRNLSPDPPVGWWLPSRMANTSSCEAEPRGSFELIQFEEVHWTWFHNYYIVQDNEVYGAAWLQWAESLTAAQMQELGLAWQQQQPRRRGGAAPRTLVWGERSKMKKVQLFEAWREDHDHWRSKIKRRLVPHFQR